MPELPDITVYLEALETRLLGGRLQKVRLLDMFVLRTFQPPIDALEGRRVMALRRLGKRIAIGFDGGPWLVMHLMIGGRLQWADGDTKPKAKNVLAHFVFDRGTLSITEAAKKRRAAVHVVANESELAWHERGGLDVLAADAATFGDVLRSENHTLKRALTDPRLFDGIGNAYSDEILHAARLSPVTLTSRLDDAEIDRLHAATQRVLKDWIQRLQAEARDRFPAKVTAFRPEMAVHGKYGQPCPDCGTAVQRIRYAENEVNYCPRCQTGGKLLADRSLSRLLKEDWPRSIDELEERRGNA